MKKLIFFFSLAAVMFTVPTYAQMTGSWNSFIYSSAGVANQAAAPSFYTKKDTITNTGVDTSGSAVDPYHNSVGFQIDVLKISGNPNGAFIQLWGSKESSQSGGYTLISVDTIRNISGMQVFNHDICGVYNIYNNSGAITIGTTPIAGNPFRWYLLTMNGAGTSSISWKSILFIR